MRANGTGKRIWNRRRFHGLTPTVFALSAVSFLNDVSSEIIYPLLPAFLSLTLGATPLAIGLIEGLAESVASTLKLFSGYLSDKFERRKLPVFLGYALAAVTRPLLAFVTTWQQVLVFRTTDRIGKGIRGAPRDAILAGEVPIETRGLAFGFNRAADHLGAVVGPLVAYFLLTNFAGSPQNPTAEDFRQVFLFASLPVVVGLFVIVFFVHEKPRGSLENGSSSIKVSLREFDPVFIRFLVIVALFTLSNSTDAFLLLRAQQAGISPAMLPILWMALHFSKVLWSIIGGDLSDKLGRRSMIIAGWLIYALVYLGFAVVEAAWQAWALFLIYGAYFGLTESAEKAFVADMVDKEKRGTAFGFYNLAYGITVFPASLLFGFIWAKFGVAAAFGVSAAISLVAATSLMMLKLPKSRQQN